MEIIRLGHSAFKIVGKDITIVTDPFKSEKVGTNFPKTEASVVTVSHDHEDHNNLEGVKGEFICFDSPGEYEIKDAEIIGVQSDHDNKGGEERGKNTIFVYEVDGIHLAHLGDLGAPLTTAQIEKINGVDVLFVPVGGTYTIGPKEAVKVISDTEPKIVIPMHYKETERTADLAPVEDFLKEIGKEAKTTDRLKLLKKDLPEQMEVVVLK